MVIRASRGGLEIRELPIALHPREGESKLSPVPGRRAGAAPDARLPAQLPVPVSGVHGRRAGRRCSWGSHSVHAALFGHEFYVHSLIGGSLLVVVGAQLVGFGLCGRAYAVYQLGDRDPSFEWIGDGACAWSTVCCSASAVIAGRIRPRRRGVGQWLAGGARQPRRGAGDDPRCDAHHRRHAGLLHVVSALAGRPAARRPGLSFQPAQLDERTPVARYPQGLSQRERGARGGPPGRVASTRPGRVERGGHDRITRADRTGR